MFCVICEIWYQPTLTIVYNISFAMEDILCSFYIFVSTIVFDNVEKLTKKCITFWQLFLTVHYSKIKKNLQVTLNHRGVTGCSSNHFGSQRLLSICHPKQTTCLHRLVEGQLRHDNFYNWQPLFECASHYAMFHNNIDPQPSHSGFQYAVACKQRKS